MTAKLFIEEFCDPTSKNCGPCHERVASAEEALILEVKLVAPMAYFAGKVAVPAVRLIVVSAVDSMPRQGKWMSLHVQLAR